MHISSAATRPVEHTALLAELRLLRERTAVVLHASEALGQQALHTCARSRAVCEATARARTQWRVWRAWRARLREHGDCVSLRVCTVCTSVCLASASASSAEAWVDPPRAIRGALDTMRHGRPLTRVICPRCAVANPRLPGAATPGIDPTCPDEASSRLLRLLDELEVIAASLAAQDPSLDAGAAFDRAYERAVESLAETLTPAEITQLTEALRDIAGRMQRPHRRHYEAGTRFRPPLGGP